MGGLSATVSVTCSVNTLPLACNVLTLQGGGGLVWCVNPPQHCDAHTRTRTHTHLSMTSFLDGMFVVMRTAPSSTHDRTSTTAPSSPTILRNSLLSGCLSFCGWPTITTMPNTPTRNGAPAHTYLAADRGVHCDVKDIHGVLDRGCFLDGQGKLASLQMANAVYTTVWHCMGRGNHVERTAQFKPNPFKNGSSGSDRFGSSTQTPDKSNA